jgi:hypothetical protein
VEQALRMTRAVHAKAEVSLRLHLEPNVPSTILADEVECSMLLLS